LPRRSPATAPTWRSAAPAGNLADAIVALQEAIALDPGNAQAHNNLGIARFDGNNFAERWRTIARRSSSSRISPKRITIWQCPAPHGKVDEAIEAYQNALAAARALSRGL